MRQLAEAKIELIIYIDEVFEMCLIHLAYFWQSVDCSNYYTIQHRN